MRLHPPAAIPKTILAQRQVRSSIHLATPYSAAPAVTGRTCPEHILWTEVVSMALIRPLSDDILPPLVQPENDGLVGAKPKHL